MFDFEKEEMQQETPEWENADWEQITHDHAAQGNGMNSDRIYSKIHTKRKDRTGIAATRYAMLAIGLTAIGYAVRSATWLAVTLGVVALVFGLISAYGAGKHSEM